MNCIETIELTHKFARDEMALDRVNLQVPESSIYGFLGPNGAGKTTMLKLVLGLLRRQQGSITILGRSLDQHRVAILRRVGSLIESPSLYDHLTAHENLNLLQKIYQCPPARINEVLELVGLPHTGRKKAGKFSLGMKQRLSIAMALLHDPELLILDEPSNGLDPNGMLELRELLATLNQTRGTTIVISSHLLSEVERLVTHIGIIDRGVLVFQGPLAELVEKQQRSSYVSLETGDDLRASKLLADRGLKVTPSATGLSLPLLSPTEIAALNRRLVESDIEVFQIRTVKSDLETIFFEMISH
ncbi:MAG: ABC transporter ATP-binding protein [Pyrinomonadaceae bacterium]